MKRLATSLAAIALAAIAFAPSARAEFGIASFDGSFDCDTGSGPEPCAAGSRPLAMNYRFQLNTMTTAGGKLVPDGSVKDILTELPPGVSGDFTKLPRCTTEELVSMLPKSGSNARCPRDSQAGVLKGYFEDPETPEFFPIYNMVPPPGTPADFGVPAKFFTVRITPSVRTGGDYGITAASLDTLALLPIFGAEASLWGVPSAESHDKERFPCLDFEKGPTGLKCPVTFPPFPLLSMPTACSGPLTSTLRVDSWQQIGLFSEESFESHDGAGNPIGLHGCGLLHFEPSLAARPDTTAADTPTGLHFNLHQPQNENPESPATAQLKRASITLPAGLLANPSLAAGLAACTEAQADLHGPGAAHCPDAAKLGTVRADVPLVDNPLEGAIYLATPYENPYGSLLAVYLSVDDPRTGVVVKLASAIRIDEATGRLTLAFDQIPQFPIEDTNVTMFGGPRAALRTAAVCGTYETSSDLTPWSTPATPDARPSDPFVIDSGPGGGPCATTPAQLPHEPSFEAATLFPVAGRYSPFALDLTRADGSQALRRLDFTLPPGLAAKLAGVEQCPEAAIAAAEARNGPHGGTEELAQPSCPAASRIGTVHAWAGAGPTPVGADGAAYLAGPYKGAPLSIVVITPAVAGPFDLGNVVVRSAVYVDPTTAQGRAVSDPIPTILKGIPLDLRKVSVELDREGFTLNPTNCEEMSIKGAIESDQGAWANPSVRFQVDECAKLGFKPKLSLRLYGGTHRGAHPRLRAVLRMPKEGANIARAAVTLPHSAFLDQAHIRTVCTRVQFAAGAGHGAECPGGAVYGYAVAKTPLFDQPLEGPVFLRSSSHQLPDLVAALRGPDSLPVEVALDGRIDSVRGGIRTTFEVVPDAPVSSFTLTMQGGRKGLIVNSTDICAGVHRATAAFRGQNGRQATLRPALQASCSKRKRARHRPNRRPAKHRSR